MQCIKCGAQNLPTNKFCTRCGNKFELPQTPAERKDNISPTVAKVQSSPLSVTSTMPKRQSRDFEIKSMSLGEIFDYSARLYFRNFKVAFLTYAIPNIPLLLISLAYSYFLTNIFLKGAMQSASPLKMAGIFLISLPISLISIFVYLFSQSAMIKLFSDLYLGYETSITIAYRHSLSKFIEVFLTTSLMILILIPCTLALIIPGIVMFVYYLLYLNVVILEDKRFMTALGKSFTLVKEYWWRTFLMIIVIMVLTWLVVSIFSYLPLIVHGFSPASFTLRTISTILSSTAQLFLQPFLSAIWLLYYYDLRIKKEGFDLEIKALNI